ncbi:hypothetical protein [Vibrio harveyi]|uniref:hypothetical protein n=1 Tax=Vibrio harveyi TaxID=669 RepID=UPI00217DAC19|nr:hypothetical protein [Vibrio harveyi]
MTENHGIKSQPIRLDLIGGPRDGGIMYLSKEALSKTEKIEAIQPLRAQMFNYGHSLGCKEEKHFYTVKEVDGNYYGLHDEEPETLAKLEKLTKKRAKKC